MKDLILFLIISVIVTAMAIASVSTFTVLCRQTFGGVWSSIVIDDCFGSYWAPAGYRRLLPDEGYTVPPLEVQGKLTGMQP